MTRIGYDSAQFYAEKSKLPAPDGVHCVICGAVFEKPDTRRRYCSPGCYNDWYESLHIRDWAAVRAFVIERDGRCMRCGVTCITYEVHHIVPISEGGYEFDPDNCITMCEQCHKMKHSTLGNKIRKNRSLEEF